MTELDKSKYNVVKKGEEMRRGDILFFNGRYEELHQRHWGVILVTDSPIFRRKPSLDPTAKDNVIKLLVKKIEKHKADYLKLSREYSEFVLDTETIQQQAFYPKDSRYHSETLAKLETLVSRAKQRAIDGTIKLTFK